ncbi:hypothetical protein SAMN05216207_104642 [Pseudonocardia ammonioxydans]|uniref:Uncharacterized protein n=1 Tax=Pseudonocardia ammonioxydans TaxID=260086 RepID=A0A1I5GGA4_PSUAM|nr:hypothetical protein [Pseudonocardia ammonioxydans]SFO35055.1 hypothetical protein SAMN05216207_104642 [Pseudonocardia ammonioxydans]
MSAPTSTTSSTATVGPGTVTAIVALTGVVDDTGDRLAVGCFARTLRARRPGFCVGQDWNRTAGITTDIRELRPGDPALPATAPDGTRWPAGAGALVATARYIDTRDGRDARALARAAGDGQSYGIGYRVPDGGARHRGGVREITDLDLYTWGPVLHGTSPFTRLTEIKSPHEGMEVKAVAGTAIRSVVDPVDMAACVLCGRPAVGTPTGDGPLPPTATAALTCAGCADRVVADLLAERGDDQTERAAGELTCAFCGERAGGRIGGRDLGRDVICPACVALMRDLADDNRRAARGDVPLTGPEEYDAARAFQRPLTMDAGANLVPDDSAAGLGWSPTTSARRRY